MNYYHLPEFHVPSSNISLEDVNKQKAKHAIHEAGTLLFYIKQQLIMLLKFHTKCSDIYYTYC
jgi:hypothetical protein